MKIQGGKAHNKHHGLLNQGATCYLNSVLQVLFLTREFRDAVNGHTNRLDLLLKDVFDELQRQTAQTCRITDELGVSRGHEQQDAAEFFERILTLISPDAAKIFHGQLTHSIICSKCMTETKTHSGMWHLPLALTGSYNEDYSVVDGIEEFFRDTHFSGLDQMYCEHCDDKVDATVKCEVKHHPEVLVLLLKRFEFDYRYMRYVKNTRYVKVPQILTISKHQSYGLYAVVDHVGDLRGGHYAATVQTQDDDNKQHWLHFNDDRVTSLGCRSLEAEKSKSAYLLFYKKSQAAVTITCKSVKKRSPLSTKCICLLTHLFIIAIVIIIVVVILLY